MDYRPPWAAAMVLEVPRSKKAHLRSGWSMGRGFEPWCRRSKTDIPIKTAIESHWVSVQDIEARDIDPDGPYTTCEACCFEWVKAAKRNAANN